MHLISCNSVGICAITGPFNKKHQRIPTTEPETLFLHWGFLKISKFCMQVDQKGLLKHIQTFCFPWKVKYDDRKIESPLYFICNEGLIGRLLFLKRTIVYRACSYKKSLVLTVTKTIAVQRLMVLVAGS